MLVPLKGAHTKGRKGQKAKAVKARRAKRKVEAASRRRNRAAQ